MNKPCWEVDKIWQMSHQVTLNAVIWWFWPEKSRVRCMKLWTWQRSHTTWCTHSLGCSYIHFTTRYMSVSLPCCNAQIWLAGKNNNKLEITIELLAISEPVNSYTTHQGYRYLPNLPPPIPSNSYQRSWDMSRLSMILPFGFSPGHSGRWLCTQHLLGHSCWWRWNQLSVSWCNMVQQFEKCRWKLSSLREKILGTGPQRWPKVSKGGDVREKLDR